jgi:hypothetical protein
MLFRPAASGDADMLLPLAVIQVFHFRFEQVQGMVFYSRSGPFGQIQKIGQIVDGIQA